MSNITFLAIKNKKLSIVTAHYRQINRLLKQKPIKTVKWLDSGYILIDYDNLTFINHQNAIAVQDPF